MIDPLNVWNLKTSSPNFFGGGPKKTFRNQEMLQSVAAMWRSKLGILGWLQVDLDDLGMKY